jgi:5,5'-dehydrodivanillate O-demethylase oxygenase subunit
MALVEEGEDPTVAFTRDKHDRIPLPCEKDKFGVNFLEFALAWLDMGSSKYSPELDTIKKLYIDAAAVRGDMPGQAEVMGVPDH